MGFAQPQQAVGDGDIHRSKLLFGVMARVYPITATDATNSGFQPRNRWLRAETSIYAPRGPPEVRIAAASSAWVPADSQMTTGVRARSATSSISGPGSGPNQGAPQRSDGVFPRLC